MDDRYLIVSDNQEPYGLEESERFCFRLKKHYKIPDENCYHTGDEADQFHGGAYPKGADYPHTPNQEIEAAIGRLRKWYELFPEMKLCNSNHGDRWKRRFFDAGIPSQMMRLYTDIIKSPKGWIWQQHWTVKAKHPFRVEHGDRFGSRTPHIMAAMHNGMSTAIGHFHSIAGVEVMNLDINRRVWGAAAGSLIDTQAYAFKYGDKARLKPVLGCLVVVNNGSLPMWIPFSK